MPERRQIVVQSLKSGKRKILMEGESAHYLPTGHLVFIVRNSLRAIPFDLKRLEIAGSPVPLIENIFRVSLDNAPQFAISDSGTLVYTTGSAAKPTLVWVDKMGKEEPLAAPPKGYSRLYISPDGTKVALTILGENNDDIWIWDLVRKTPTRLTFDTARDMQSIWTPDGKRIVFASNRGGNYGVYWKAADGTGKEELLGSAPGRDIYPFSWAKDGKTLATVEVTASTADIGELSMEGDHAMKLLLHEKYSEFEPRISPDGLWMAYVSVEMGKYEVYVCPFPNVESGGKRQVSTSGGDSPLWSPDGRELFYRNGDSFIAVEVETKPTFSLGQHKTLFRGAYVGFEPARGILGWDINKKDKRFLMMKEAESTPTAAGPRLINVVLNWFEELKKIK
jgi:eukaryotic-like serine/threonine-protein kinase